MSEGFGGVFSGHGFRALGLFGVVCFLPGEVLGLEVGCFQRLRAVHTTASTVGML